MKLGKFSQALLFAGSVYALGSMTVPIANAVTQSLYEAPPMGTILEDLEIKERFENIDYPAHYGVKDVLKLSHFVFSTQLKPSRGSGSFDPAIDYAIDKRRATCNEFAYLVYLGYVELLKKKGKEQFADNVVIATGEMSDNLGVDGHVWLKFKDGKGWHNYETLVDFFDQDDWQSNFIGVDMEEILPDKAVIDLPKKEYRQITESWLTDDGEILFVPTLTATVSAPYWIPKRVLRALDDE